MLDAEFRLEELVDRAECGDDACLVALRRDVELRRELTERAEALARQASSAWIELAAGGDTALADSVRARLEGLRIGQAGPGTGALERRLMTRIALLGLRTGALDAGAGRGPGRRGVRYRVEALERRHGRARRAYESALKDLATLRRLLGPKPKAGARSPECR